MYEFSGEKDTEAYSESPENALNILNELFTVISRDELKELQILICGAVGSEKYKKELVKKLNSLNLSENAISTITKNLNHDLWLKIKSLSDNLKIPESAFNDKETVDDILELLSERVHSVFEAIPEFYEALEILFPSKNDRENASLALTLLQGGRRVDDMSLCEGLLSDEQLNFLKKYSDSELDIFEEFLEQHLD
jgi:hypothetical protein